MPENFLPRMGLFLAAFTVCHFLMAKGKLFDIVQPNRNVMEAPIRMSMTTLIDSVTAPDPRYATMIKHITEWASFENATAKLPAKNGEDCKCSVDVPNDIKKWTEADLTKVATSKFGYDIYDTLQKLAVLAQETTVVTDQNGKKKVVAKNPDAITTLAKLAPEGMNANDFYKMIVRVNTNNYALVEKTKNEGKKYDADEFIFFMKEEYNLTKLDKKNDHQYESG